MPCIASHWSEIQSLSFLQSNMEEFTDTLKFKVDPIKMTSISPHRLVQQVVLLHRLEDRHFHLFEL